VNNVNVVNIVNAIEAAILAFANLHFEMD